MRKGRFVIGQYYEFTDWFTGEILGRLVTSVGINHVWFTVFNKTNPDEPKSYEDRDILLDDNDNEYVLLYIYQDNEARIYADIINVI